MKSLTHTRFRKLTCNRVGDYVDVKTPSVVSFSRVKEIVKMKAIVLRYIN